jgi:hypothetical protein
MFKKIIICSCPRTGSTLVYNLIKEVFDTYTVEKTHKIDNFDNENLYIIPIRHPYNSIISIGLCNKLQFDKQHDLLNCVNNYLDYGGNDIINIQDTENILHLHYENFYNNLEYVYKSIEEKLNINIPEYIKTDVIKKHSLENVKNLIKNMNDFKLVDNETQYHGLHISKYNGNTNYRLILSEDQIKYLKKITNLNKIIEKFNYK